MNRNRVEKIIEYVKGSPETMDYGRWGALNPEQRKIIKELCNSWLILDKATNIQTKEIEKLNNIIKEVREYCNNDNNFEIMTDFDTFENHNIIGKDILEILDKGSDKE